MPVERILNQRCWWCWRHLEGQEPYHPSISPSPRYLIFYLIWVMFLLYWWWEGFRLKSSTRKVIFHMQLSYQANNCLGRGGAGGHYRLWHPANKMTKTTNFASSGPIGLKIGQRCWFHREITHTRFLAL